MSDRRPHRLPNLVLTVSPVTNHAPKTTMTTINSSHECHASNSGDNEQRKFSDSSDCESRDSFDAMAVENADAAVEALRVGDHRRILSAKTELDFLLASIGGESGRVPRRSRAAPGV